MPVPRLRVLRPLRPPRFPDLGDLRELRAGLGEIGRLGFSEGLLQVRVRGNAVEQRDRGDTRPSRRIALGVPVTNVVNDLGVLDSDIGPRLRASARENPYILWHAECRLEGSEVLVKYPMLALESGTWAGNADTRGRRSTRVPARCAAKGSRKVMRSPGSPTPEHNTGPVTSGLPSRPAHSELAGRPDSIQGHQHDIQIRPTRTQRP